MTSSNATRLLLAASLLGVPTTGLRAQQGVLKFATLAPEGSTWMKVMGELNKELQEKTGGKVRFKFYPGGVSGDEKDVVKKMRVGQLHAAGVTGVGLGEVAPEVRILDAPFLFRDSSEVDAVVSRFEGDFEKALDAKGFALLGWVEVGLVYVLTNTPITKAEDMKAAKMWVWEGDAIAEAAFTAFGVNPIPLSITDVMTSLQTGLVNGVYSSPMAAIALQWFTKTKFIYNVPMANASGAILVTKKALDALPEADRKVLLEVCRKHTRRLTELSREENRNALETLQKQGLSMTKPASPDALKEYEEVGRKARRTLAGKLYSAELLDKVEKSLGEHRAGGGKSSPGKPAAAKKDGKAKGG